MLGADLRDWLPNGPDKVKKKRAERLSYSIRFWWVLHFAVVSARAFVFFGLLAGLYGVCVANRAVRYVGGLGDFLIFHEYKCVKFNIRFQSYKPPF